MKDARDLRQSILKKAFEGRLVPQDPSEEPASELLKKIQKEKQEWQEALKAKKKTSQPKTRMEALTIEQVLKKAKEPISPKELWENSKHKHDIEEFYMELKRLGDKVVEIKSDTESLLRLVDAH